MELWKFVDYKNYTSLDLLAYKFGIATPKDDIDGSMVGKIYWEEKDLSRIVRYCEKDAITVAQLFLCYRGIELIDQDHIEYVTD
ncbi:MAG: 3'-5' exonuclease, partial [Bacteroidota bacterium]